MFRFASIIRMGRFYDDPCELVMTDAEDPMDHCHYLDFHRIIKRDHPEYERAFIEDHPQILTIKSATCGPFASERELTPYLKMTGLTIL